ncbi:hypothetical protein PLESTB_000307500 [Pleodorina starrii]|uniref:Sugar phosphate transporter domain-containing protein n=1 Tax=Pleodorina starrii TaxID=330485 RepID=A0A9W6BDY2_9CHLO|nr:hypothetical protein PLESTM_001718100 [Pleodorina starrii]GLC49776.1 hypothetical protein PLESTB_000307500 [Pleodorina starrii]GLC76263.1 hypothetical protein PLESTF_001756800 [Pleodorina starrii]
MWLGILVAVAYGAIAVLANFVNKYAIRVLPLPNVILFIQTLTAVLILRLMAAAGIIRVPPLREVPLLRLAPLAAWYTAHAALVLCSLASLSVPMYNTLKRLTPVLVLTAKAVVDRVVPDANTTLSVLLVVSGCFVAGAGDLSFDLQGYVLALMATVAQAAYILSAEREVQGKGGKPAPAIAAAVAAGGKTAAGQQQHQQQQQQPVEIYVASDHISAPLLPPQAAKGDDAGGEQGGAAAPTEGCATRKWGAGHAEHSFKTGGGPCTGGGNGNGNCKDSGISSSSSSSRNRRLSAPELLYCLSLMGMPALAVMCIVTGEGERAPQMVTALRAQMGDSDFAAWFGVMAVTNGLLNGGVILCTQMNSALTTAIVGVLKGAVSSVLGFFLLGGVKFHALNVAGITMNMVGGIWYSGYKYVQQQKRGGGGGGSVLSG